MPRQARVFRIFVSSTFDDMKAEREVLQEKVFPELQRLCELAGCTFQAVDLRWGVSEEAALDQQAMNICLTELKRCRGVSPRPNFVILLGNRYGWIPLPPKIDSTEFDAILDKVTDGTERDLLTDWYRLDTNAVPAKYTLRARQEDVIEERDYVSWGATEEEIRSIFLKAIDSLGWDAGNKSRIIYECSATHQEIIEGAMNLPDEREHVFAFFRDIENKSELPAGSPYFDSNTERVEALKNEIRNTAGVTSFEYRASYSNGKLDYDLDIFAANALDSLRRIIDEEIRQLEQISELTKEDLAHEEFGTARQSHFVGRRGMLNEMAAYLRGNSEYPLVVYGPSGCGKSALLAKAASESIEAFEVQKHVRIIQRYIGATPISTDIRSLLKNLCEEIYERLDFEEFKRADLENIDDTDRRSEINERWSIPDDYAKLSERFREFVGTVPEDKTLVLYLDALDQLNDSDSAHSLNWLPQKLNPNVRLVVSALEREDEAGQCLKSAQIKYRDSQMLHVQDMEPDEGRDALKEWLDDAKRTLTASQQAILLSGFADCPQPLYLRLAFEEAKLWKSYDTPPPLARDTRGIVLDMLARLSDEKNHGPVLVNTFLGLLSASRQGLTENEILELLSCDKVMNDLNERSSKSPEAKTIPAAVWLRLYSDLASYMLERSVSNAVLLGFYHRQIQEAIQERYSGIEHHEQLAGYYIGKPLWLDETIRIPNSRRCYELPYQQTAAEMWDPVVETLTDLDFVDAKSRAGLVYDLVSDYNRALAALPEMQEEHRKEEERRKEIDAYVAKLIVHSSNPDENLLPEPPQSVEIQPLRPASERKGDWTRVERLNAWAHYVGTHLHRLAAGEEPVFQMAWNSYDSGPVAERLSELQINGKGPTTEWLKLRNRPEFVLNPACLKTLEGHTSYVLAVSITPDGCRAVSGSSDNTLRLWDLETGQCLKTLEGHTSYVFAVSITPDGRRAVSGSDDETIRLWDLETGQCLKTLEGHTNSVSAVSITPDGRRAVSGSDDETLRLWDLETGQCLKTLEGHTSEVNAVSITTDGRRAVFGSDDWTLRLWDLDTGECLKTMKGHTSYVSAVSITTDGRRTVSASRDKTLRLWDLETGQCLKVLEGHTDWVSSVSITPDGRRAVSGSVDDTLRLWDLKTGQCLKLLEGHTSSVYAVSITPDGCRAVSSGGSDKTLRLWDLETGQCLKTLEGHTNSVSAVSVTPDGCSAVSSGSEDNTLRLWDLETGVCLRTLEGHTNSVYAVSITPDGRRAVSGSYDNAIRLWDLETGQCLKTLEGHTDVVDAVSVTPDGRRAVSGSYDNTLRLWDLETGQCLNTIEGRTSWLSAVSITPDGSRAVSGSDDETIRLWDLETGQCLNTLEGHTDVVSAVSISPDGRRAVSGSMDHTLRIWDLDTGQCLKILEGHTTEVYAVSITPDGRRAVSGSLDNTLRIWDLETGECVVVCQTITRVMRIAVNKIRLVAGESGGRVDVISIENYDLGLPIVTSVRLWLFDRQSWDSCLTAQCCWCGNRFTVLDDWIGKEITCPADGCGKLLKLNPFVCDNSDWLQ